jgi:hypothetical protein
VTVMGTRISSRQPQFSKEDTKSTKEKKFNWKERKERKGLGLGYTSVGNHPLFDPAVRRRVRSFDSQRS